MIAVLSVLPLSRTMTWFAQVSSSRQRPRFGPSFQVRITGVICVVKPPFDGEAGPDATEEGTVP